MNSNTHTPAEPAPITMTSQFSTVSTVSLIRVASAAIAMAFLIRFCRTL